MDISVPKWNRRFVETMILIQARQFRAWSFDAYRDVERQWRADEAEKTKSRDARRFARLARMAEAAGGEIIGRHNARLLFDVLRAVSPDEMVALLGLSDPYGAHQVVRCLSRWIGLYGRVVRPHAIRDGTTIVIATESTKQQIAALPRDLARLYGVALLADEAGTHYRAAGKGMRLAPQWHQHPPRFTPGADRWRFLPNAELVAALTNYGRRRRETGGGVAGLPAKPFPRELGIASWAWLVAGPVREPIRVEYPELGVTLADQPYFLDLEDQRDRLRQLGDFGDEFMETFGFSVGSFEHICRNVARAVFEASGTRFLVEAVGRNGTGRSYVYRAASPQDPGWEDRAPANLRDIMSEGVLRLSLDGWRELLRAPAAVGGPQPDEKDVDAFISAFTVGRRVDPRKLGAALFHQFDENFVVIDLLLAGQFLELCYRAVARDDKKKRGPEFEDRAISEILERLSLDRRGPGVLHNHRIVDDRGPGEIDLCFLVGTVAVVVEMKSWVRTVGYHNGDRDEFTSRQEQLQYSLRRQADRYARVAVRELRDAGHDVSGAVSFLCTADVEFVAPRRRALWYGETPRVLTAAEIADLVLDPDRWRGVVGYATAHI